MPPPYEAAFPLLVFPAPGSVHGSPASSTQNLMLPIIPAMFVVSSLIVGATVEEAR